MSKTRAKVREISTEINSKSTNSSLSPEISDTLQRNSEGIFEDFFEMKETRKKMNSIENSTCFKRFPLSLIDTNVSVNIGVGEEKKALADGKKVVKKSRVSKAHELKPHEEESMETETSEDDKQQEQPQEQNSPTSSEVQMPWTSSNVGLKMLDKVKKRTRALLSTNDINRSDGSTKCVKAGKSREASTAARKKKSQSLVVKKEEEKRNQVEFIFNILSQSPAHSSFIILTAIPTPWFQLPLCSDTSLPPS